MILVLKDVDVYDPPAPEWNRFPVTLRLFAATHITPNELTLGVSRICGKVHLLAWSSVSISARILNDSDVSSLSS